MLSTTLAFFCAQPDEERRSARLPLKKLPILAALICLALPGAAGAQATLEVSARVVRPASTAVLKSEKGTEIRLANAEAVNVSTASVATAKLDSGRGVQSPSESNKTLFITIEF